MKPRAQVTSMLVRIYRPIALWFWATMILCVAVGGTVVNVVTDPGFSLWLMIAGSAAKYWLGVVGVLLVATNLRQFVANGITRRDFMAGAAVFGLISAVLFALMVPLGHGVEHLLLQTVGGTPAPGYPEISLAAGLREFGQVLPAHLAFLVTGGAASAGFYRFGAWGGLALLIPAALPVAAAEGLLGIDEHGHLGVRFLPLAAALLISLAVTAVAALLFRWELRNAAIRRGTT
jgi:hypothetical protein